MKRQRPEMNFAVQDVTDMADFAQDQQFTVALDKGTYLKYVKLKKLSKLKGFSLKLRFFFML